MNHEEEILNWMSTAILYPLWNMSERFYFDKKSNQFFSIHAFDYSLFEEDYTISKEAVSSYTEIELNFIANKIKRIENNDSEILLLIPANNKEKENLINELALHSQDKQLQEFLFKSIIKYDDMADALTSKYNPEESPDYEIWQQLKSQFTDQKAKEWFNEKGVDINACSIYHLAQSVSMKFDLEKDQKTAKRPWWKLWV